MDGSQLPRKTRRHRTIEDIQIDIALGARIRACRRHLGMSQKDLAKPLGLCFQQVQKYECGTSAISASLLIRVARALGTTAAALIDESDIDVQAKTKASA